MLVVFRGKERSMLRQWKRRLNRRLKQMLVGNEPPKQIRVDLAISWPVAHSSCAHAEGQGFGLEDKRRRLRRLPWFSAS
jgi:hypothetical protein